MTQGSFFLSLATTNKYIMKRIRKPVVPGNIIQRKVKIPSYIKCPPYVFSGHAGSVVDAPLALYKLNSKEIQALRSACAIAREGLEFAASLVKPGVTTEEIDVQLTDFFINKKKVYPSPINYLGFPKSLCTSINEIMVHGIPDDRPLEDGDIVSLDVSCYVDGVHGDNCMTVQCGKPIDENAENLLKDSKSCFDQVLNVCGPGVPINAIGNFISSWCEKHGYDTNKDFIGHGIGPIFHMKPLVFNCYNTETLIMQPGLVFTIEPIICENSAESGDTWKDGWTVPSKDGSWSTQFEHTILITETGFEILTKI